MSKIEELIKLKQNIFEGLKYLKDIPLFFTSGKLYFAKIQRESLATNIYRLSVYYIFSLLIQASFFTLKSKSLIYDNPFEIIGMLLLQLPIVSCGYYLALWITDIKPKLKVCLNYVLFQNSITTLIPLVFVTAFVCSEKYIFYYAYVFFSSIFVIFMFLWFSWLFNKTILKQIMCVVIIMATTYAISFLDNKLEIPRDNMPLSLFEDPIASEFFRLDCMNDINKFKINHDVEETLGLVSQVTNILSGDVEVGELTFILQEGSLKKLANNWNLIKSKEYAYANKNIEILSKKLDRAKFNHNKELINENIILYKNYITFLDEYEIGIRGLLNVDYTMLYKFISYKNKSKNKKNNAVNNIDEIKDKSVIDTNVKKYLQAMAIVQNAAKGNIAIVKSAIALKKKTITYNEFVISLENRLPVYYHRVTPLKEYELQSR